MNRKRRRKLSKLTSGLIVIFNIITVTLTFIAYLSNYISPEKFWQPAFIGLILPFLILMNLIFILFWLIVKPKFILISALTLIAGFRIITAQFQLNYPSEFERTRDDIIHVASFNTHFFNIWAKYGVPQYETFNMISNYFANSNLDILAMQEGVISHERTGYISDTFKRKTGFQTFFSAPYYENGHSGLIIYHNGKTVNTGSIEHNNRTIAIYADIKLNNRAFRIYNFHLQSIYLGEQEYVMDLLGIDAYKDSAFILGTKDIIKKMRRSFIKRASQVKMLHEHIASSELPVILCGDLNDTPCSFAYTKIKKGLKDAFVQAGRGMGRTYLGKFPSFRIDYIFVSKDIEVKSFRTGSKHLSDHKPLFTYLKLP